MSLTRFLVFSTFVLMLWHESTITVLADGCYLPSKTYKTLPTIPTQRALLTWKDGVETLTISSTVDSESQQLGWIIPLPNVPDQIEKASPGMLKTLAICIQPKIIEEGQGGFFLIFLILAILALYNFLFVKKRFWRCLVLLLILLLLFLVLVVTPVGTKTAGFGPTGASRVLVEKTAKVGSYDINVLRSKSAADLNGWLTENGFASLPTTADPILADYIRADWVFAAIKLTREQAGASTPHPIRMAFKSPVPIYPMRLTALARSNPMLELYVVADQRAACSSLEEEFCDRFIKSESFMFMMPEHYKYQQPDLYHATTSGLEIGHPELVRAMWPNCVLTKFSGVIPASQMTRDIQFGWEPFQPHRKRLYTPAAARSTSWNVHFALFLLAVLITMPLSARRIRQTNDWSWYFKWILLPLFALSMLSSSRPPTFPTIEPYEFEQGSDAHYHVTTLATQIYNLMQTDPGVRQKSAPEIASYLQAHIKPDPDTKASTLVNPLTGGPLEIEESPGNFTIEKNSTNLVIRVYDLTGQPMSAQYPVPSR